MRSNITVATAFFAALAILAPTVRGGRGDPLFAAFQDPPSRFRPFVRWWWNGSRVNEAELLRELDVMKAGGIGGVEINTIAMHDAVPKEGLAAFPERPWLSPEWCRAVRAAAEGARERGMTADLIVGSGWPFGGRFLAPGEQTKRVRVAKKQVAGPTVFETALEDLATDRGKSPEEVSVPSRLAFARLVPAGLRDFSPGKELGPGALRGGHVRVPVPRGPHVVYLGILETGFTHVKLGAPGADGPVVDHWSAAAVKRYLDHMSAGLSPSLGGRLGERQGGPLRAAFVDSLELDHANWTDDLPAEFARRRGYELGPYLPFILDRDDGADTPFADTVRRARYDYHRTVVELFHERFLQTYVGWAHENGLLARIQAYGRETHALEGSLLVDLPEGETWLWSGHDRIVVSPTVADKYVSSAAHLAGRGPVSFEAMTNAIPVFREMPEDFKLGMDLSLLAGVQHPILHGFNYSPPEAGFPGWVRFGSWLNERNPWWPHFRRWADYAARLTTVLAQSEYQARVALLGPKADEWARDGLLYQPFPEVSRPWYHYHLWQALQQAGYGTDFVSEGVLRDARAEDGSLLCRSRSYDTLVLLDVGSLEPETAEAVLRFARAGGGVVFVGQAPHRAPGLHDAETADRRVREAIARTLEAGEGRTSIVPAPEPGGALDGDFTRGPLPDHARRSLLQWVITNMPRLGEPDVRVTAPHPDVGLLHHRAAGRDLFFLASASRTEALDLEARFPTGDRLPWRWNPETGARRPMPHRGRPDTLAIHLEPLESLLVAFEPADDAAATAPVGSLAVTPRPGREWLPLLAPWDVEFRPASGEPFRRRFTQLYDLSLAAGDPSVAGFGGVAVYRAAFESDERERTVLGLGTVNGVSEVRLNGRSLGVRWWGRHLYDTRDTLVKGRNVLEVEVTTTLGNHVRTLKDNPVAHAWAWWFPPIPAGLVGPVQFMKPSE